MTARDRRRRDLAQALRASTDAINVLREKREQLESAARPASDREREYRELLAVLYVKKMAVESMRFGLLTAKLEELDHRGGTAAEPSESVESMLLTLAQTDRAIELENDIFDLEMQKWNLSKAMQLDDGGDDARQQETMRALSLPPPSTTTAQQQTWELLGRPVKHAFVHELLQDGTSFVNRKIAQYMSSIKNANGKRARRPSRSLPRRSKKDVSYDDRTEDMTIPELIDALALHLLVEFSDKVWALDEAAIKLELEGHIFSLMYKQLLARTDTKALDDQVAGLCRQLQFIGQAEMKVPASLQSPELVPFAEAIEKLRRVVQYETPTEKLYAIHQAAQAVYATVSMYHPSDTMGGDGFMDVWVYVVLKAGISNLFANIEFIRAHASVEQLHGELGYYFSSLELAAAYLKDLDMSQLVQTPQVLIDEPLVVCECEKYRQLAREKPFVTIDRADVVLKGYRLCAVQEWLFSPAHFHHTAALRTGRDEDELHGVVVRINVDKISVQQRAFVESIWLRPQGFAGLQLHKTPFGPLLVADPQNPDLRLTLIPLVITPTEDEAEAMENVRFVVTLERLGCGKDRPSLASDFIALHGLDPLLPAMHQAAHLCREIQISLQHLGFVSLTAPLDDFLSDATMVAVRRFQSDFNIRESSSVASSNRLSNLLVNTDDDDDDDDGSTGLRRMGRQRASSSSLWPSLRTDGIADVLTCRELRGRLAEICTTLTRLSRKVPADPIRSYHEFRLAVRAFQESAHVAGSGVWSDETAAAAQNIINSLERDKWARKPLLLPPRSLSS